MASRAILPEPSFKEAEEIQQFWNEHHEELLERYPEQFVAVKDGEVVAANADLALLVYELRDMSLDPRTDVAIEFVTATLGSQLL